MTGWTPLEAANYKGPDRVVHFSEYLAEEEKKPKPKGFASGFTNFDKRLGVVEPGRVVVVSGYGKHGKTLFAESWIKNAVDHDATAKALVFSFEIQASKLMEKHAAHPTRPIYLPRELKPMDFDWLYRRCQEAKFKYNAKIVLIDHLHFIVDMNTKQNMSLNIGAFMRRLKLDIAMGLNLGVFLIAHQAKNDPDEEASMRGARDSTFIGQESDAFISVTRRKNFTTDEFAEIGKKRGIDVRMKLELVTEKNHAEFPADAGMDDKYSQGLAVVKVDCSRMTGVFESRTLFVKDGNFLKEV